LANYTTNCWQEHVITAKPKFLINGTVIRDRQLIANKYNEYFTTIVSELTKDITTVKKSLSIIFMEFMKYKLNVLAPITTDETRLITEK